MDSLERSRNTSLESESVRRRKQSDGSDRRCKRSPELLDLLNVQALSRRRHSSNLTSDEVNSSLEYTDANRPDILDSLTRRRRNVDAKRVESELHKVTLTEMRRRSTESADSEDESSSPKLSKRNKDWADTDSESEEIRSLLRRSSSQLEASEAQMELQEEASPDILRFDYVRTQFDSDFSSSYISEAGCSSRRLRARICLAVAALSIMVIVYIHLQ